MSDDRTIVYTFPKGRDSEVRASLSTFKSKRYADVRVYIADENDEMHPTKKGISVNVDDLPKLLQAVTMLCEACGVAVEVAA